jgi:hypothetical protein
MYYESDGSEISLGDHVIVEGNVRGRVVCDFDRWVCLDGYEAWLSKKELVGGGTLSSGIMVETKEIGMVHYATDDAAIVRDPAATR